jgi:hypothetical protein
VPMIQDVAEVIEDFLAGGSPSILGGGDLPLRPRR